MIRDLVYEALELVGPSPAAFLTLVLVGVTILTVIALGVPRATVVKGVLSVRATYLAIFFSLLVAINLVPLYALPLNDLHKFTDSGPEKSAVYQMYVVDDDDDLLRFDRRVVPTPTPPTAWPRNLVRRCSRETRTAIGRYLLHRARQYREAVERGAGRIRRALDFPRHHLDRRWTSEELASFGTFVELRVFRTTVRFEEHSYAVADRSTMQVFGVTTPDGYEPPRLSDLPRCS